MKTYINAWRGPWGWRQAFYEWAEQNPGKVEGLELVDDIAEAALVFQGDTNDWRALVDLDGGVRCVCNVLDFGEWLGVYHPNTMYYVTQMKKRGAKFTAISSKVINQLREHFDIEAEMFYYPSQVTNKIQNLTAPMAKKNIVSFCRLADPGKAITEAIHAFVDSGLADDGWKYRLIGPEEPPIPIGMAPGVQYMGYMEDPISLYMMVYQSAYVFMPSRGEGLGLPAIEGHLLATPFIARNIQPVNTIFDSIWDPRCSFTSDLDMADALRNAANDFKSENYMHKVTRGFAAAMPWQREAAFESLVALLRRHSE